MRAIDRKVLRDLWHLRGPGVAIALVTACGVASFVTMRSMVHHLTDMQRDYYATARFGDVFAHVKRAPRSLVRDIAALPGVEAADAWVTGEVILDVPGLAEPASGHVVGLLEQSPARLNQITVVRGRVPAMASRDEVMLSEGFADANTLALGDTIGAVINGRWRKLRVVGVGISPEFVYELRPGDVFPDNRRYGVLWMDDGVVATDFGMTGAWNDLALRLLPGALERDVIQALDDRLDRYGSFGAFGRDRHVSHRYVSEEIGQNRTFAAIIPAIFLGVAAFLLNLALGRIVATQREQIGMLKAFGYGEWALARHYVLIALGPVVVGGIAGCAIGWWAAHGMAGRYQEFFRFPNPHFTPRAGVFVGGIAASVTAAVIGAVGAVRRVTVLAPAAAMQNEVPATFSRGALERLRLDRVFGPVGRMTVRTLLRRPLREMLSVLGLALGASVLIVGSFSYDAIAVMRDLQFEHADREDVLVAFTAPRGAAVVYELARLPGVTRVEPIRAIAVRLRHAGRERQTALVGLDPAAELRRAVRSDGSAITPPANGIAMSRVLGRLLDIGIGDSVTVELLEGRRTTSNVAVAIFVDDVVGTGAWMAVPELTRLAGVEETISGAALASDPARAGELFQILKRTPGVSGVTVRRALLQNFDALIKRGFSTTLAVLITFACAIAAGVVYNTARLTLSERGRELASLRVLGFTRGEVARMLFGEQAALTAVSLPIGTAIGAALAWWTVRAIGSTELWRMPFTISPRTFANAVLLIVGAAVASGFLVRRRLDRLDLVAVLKTRE